MLRRMTFSAETFVPSWPPSKPPFLSRTSTSMRTTSDTIMISVFFMCRLFFSQFYAKAFVKFKHFHLEHVIVLSGKKIDPCIEKIILIGQQIDSIEHADIVSLLGIF